MPGRRSPRRTNDDPLLDLDKTLAELTTKSPSTATDGPMDAFLANSLQAQDHQQSLAFVPASSFSFLMDDETSLSTMLLDSPAGIDTAVHADDSQFSFVQDLMSSSLESMSPTLSGSGFDDDDDEIPDQVGQWMDEALHESGAGDSFESILVSPSEGTAQTEHDSGLLQELQDQLGPDFDPDADLEGGNQRKKSHGRRRKKSSAAIMQGTPLPGRLSTTFGKANTAYTLGQYQESIRLFHEIIKEAPQASQPWAQVAMIYDELGETLKSLQAYLIAAHLIKTDADLWRRIGEMSLSTGNEEQAVYCFSKAIRLNPEDCDSIWERSSIYQKQERFEKAILGFKSVLDLVPFHMATIKELAKIYVRLGDPQAALDLFESALSTPLSEDEKKVLERKAQRKLQGNTSDASESTDDDQAEDDVFQDENEEVIGDYSLGAVVSNSSASRIGFEELNMMCELYFDLSDFSKASAVIIECIQKLKQLDLMSSENDSSHSIDQRIDELEIPVEIRVKLGICRLREDRISDAKLYFKHIIRYRPQDYADLYYEVVDAYIAKRLFTNALPLLEKMIETEETDVPETWTRMAESMHHLGNSKSAIDLYNSVLELRPNDNDIRLKLAEIYSELGDSELAVEMANQMEAISKIAQVQDMNSDTTLVAQPVAEEEQDDDALEGTTIEGSSKSRPRRNLPLGQKDKMLIILEEKNKIQETRQLYDKIQSLLSSINEFLVRRDCLRTFRKLVAPFIRAREFYPADRAKKFAGFRLPNSLKDDPFLREAYAKDMFRGLHFEQWYQAFIEYAHVATLDGKGDEAQEVLKQAFDANVFYHNEPKKVGLLLHMIASGLYCDKLDAVSDHCRWFCAQKPFQNDVFRLYLACFTGNHPEAVASFAASHNQKHFTRQVKNMEKKMKASPTLENQNPILYTLYGHIFNLARSFVPAIQYYMKAYRLAPKDPLINLSLGIAHIQRSMQRKSKDRHEHINCGLLFMMQYQELVGETQESHYNMGRIFHHIGINHLAIHFYEKTLEQQQDESRDLRREAAFNLVQLYSQSGSYALAQRIMRKHLTF